MQLRLLCAALVTSGLVGCRTTHVRVVDAGTGAPIAGATVSPDYFSKIMGYPVTGSGPAKRTDANGEATFHAPCEFEFDSFNVNGVRIYSRPRWAKKRILGVHQVAPATMRAARNHPATHNDRKQASCAALLLQSGAARR